MGAGSAELRLRVDSVELGQFQPLRAVSHPLQLEPSSARPPLRVAFPSSWPSFPLVRLLEAGAPRTRVYGEVQRPRARSAHCVGGLAADGSVVREGVMSTR